MKTVSEQLRAWGACVDGFEWAVKNCTTMAEVWDKCERGDWLIWLLRQNGWGSKEEKVRVAVACAEHVLLIFEKKHPDDERPRKAIEAAKAWLANPCMETAADAAAYAAYAAAAAADAAAAAAAAAYAAADAAAYAAAYAADAAADADDAERKWQADAIRRIVGNPFRDKETT